MWIDKSINIINDYNYKFKMIEENKVLEEPKKEETSSTSQNITKQPIFICQKSDLYGIYLKAGQKLYLE